MSLFKNFYKNKRIIITGDTGFKGSWLAIWLLELGAEVYGYALPPKTERDNYVVCNLGNKVNHIDGDVRDEEKLVKYFQEIQPDFAFHFAAQPLVLESYKNPRYTYETNIMGTVNFFEAIRKTKSVKVAINITSDKCYRNNEWLWGYRENDPMGGKDPYSSSKGCSELITEAYLESFFKQSHCKVASVRAGNVIGAGDWAVDRIVPDFFRAYLKKEPLEVRNPEATRPWQHVLEPLSGYLLLAARLYENQNLSGGWNFGPKYEMNHSVRELIAKMKKYEPSVDIDYKISREKKYEAKMLRLDISKALHLLKWEPILSFEETVQLTVKGYINDIKVKENAYRNRIDTINTYINIAKQKKVKWIKG